jgi:hypothetical protein
MMVTPDVALMGGAGVGADWTSMDDAMKARVSPLRSTQVTQMINDRLDRMRAFGYDFADFADEGLAQRALALANDKNIPNMDPEAIRQKLRKDIFLAVTLHEVGHNMGLRHNFRASFDSMNYFDNYWTLRTAGLTDTMRYTGVSGSTVVGVPYKGADCNTAAKKGKLRPRYIDCPGGATSVSEVQGQVREYQYSSIMDYGAEFNSDLMGLGKYDKAAMKFSYAGDGFVEVFKNAKTDNNSSLKWSAIHAFQNAFGFPSPLSLTAPLASINYTTYPDLFYNGAADISQRDDVPYSQIMGAPDQGQPNADSQGRIMVPYFFCSDEFVGNLTCQRFDSGADAFEQSQDLISRYNNFYLLNNFKRDRYTFHTSLAYKDRIASRYLNVLREQLTWYVLLRADFADFFGDDTSFFADENGWGSFSEAVTNGFNTLGNVISQPQAGEHTFVPASTSPDYPVGYFKKTNDQLVASQAGNIAVGLISGKYIDTTWDVNNCGYYWADECQTRIGYFIDKTVALDVLSQSQAYFTGRDTSTDVRKYAIGYILPFRNQIEEKLGALLSGDYASLAPRVTDMTDPSNPVVAMPNWNLNKAATDGGTATNIIDPSTGFSLQLYTGVYGLSAFPTTFDHSFIDTTRIFVVGNGEAPVPDAQLQSPDSAGSLSTSNPTKLVANGGTATYFVWTDNDTGKMYASHSSPAVPNNDGTAGTYRVDTGVRMLEQALALQTAATIACASNNTATCSAKSLAVTNFRENIDVMRSLHNAFGYATYKSDAPFIY